MWNKLHGFAKVVAFAFLADNVFKYLTRCEIVELAEGAIGKSLIMPKIKICLRSVIKHVYFAVLVWGHSAWVDVEIGVKFL